MQRENLRRFLFVSAACLLSFPWLTPCVGIWGAMAVDGTHNAVTHRDRDKLKLPTPQLEAWSEKKQPKLTVSENQTVPASMRIEDAELAWTQGGRNAPRPGTLVGKGASAAVDGLTYTLAWVDPVTWVVDDPWRVKPSTPRRQLVLCQSPYVVLQAQSLRFTREGKTGPVRLAKAKRALVTVITPGGSYSIWATEIHYRSPSQEMLLVGTGQIFTPQMKVIEPAKVDSSVKLNFVKHTLAFDGKLKEPSRLFWKPTSKGKAGSDSLIDGLLLPTNAGAYPYPAPTAVPKVKPAPAPKTR
ncbi:hypothetical protein [Prosthecobacter sp.]|uniref:hypothetical protein n=1 Tax=Prosthecobacter sp. TaxID=1965333 RepID=UPI003784827B